MCYSLPSVSSSDRVNLSVQVGALRLANPVIAASGTFGYGLELAHLVDLNRLGGFVTKGISLEPIGGALAPRLCETPSGMLNAVGLQNMGVAAFLKDKLSLLQKYNTNVSSTLLVTPPGTTLSSSGGSRMPPGLPPMSSIFPAPM